MNRNSALRQYWRVPLVALLAAALAFAASFLLEPRYESSTRLLVHGRSATFLTSTGQDLSTQPGVVDASLSQALLSTYAGIATSRTVATDVVEELKLDRQPTSTSVYAPVTQAVGWLYRCGRAFVTSGFCAPVDPYERAVLGVQETTTAEPVGTNAGSTSGQPGSYVLEVRAAGRTPEQARDVTNAVVERLVRLSDERFKRDAEARVDSLQTQVDAAEKELTAKTKAVAAFQTKNGISSGDAKQALSAGTLESIRSDLLKANANLSDTRAQAASTERRLSRIPKDQQSKQTIVTGRSTTEMNTDTTSEVYNELLTKLSVLQAEEAGYLARIDRLNSQIDSAKLIKLNGPLAQLAVLQQRADLASDTLRSLTGTHQAARGTAAQGSVDLSRLDEASTPTYPAAPKRYIYLALGLLVGALAGAALTAWARRPARASRRADAAAAALPADETEQPLDLTSMGEDRVNGNGRKPTNAVHGDGLSIFDDDENQELLFASDATGSDGRRSGPSPAEARPEG